MRCVIFIISFLCCMLSFAANNDEINQQFFASLTQAALNGDDKASANLGVFYHEGIGVARNYTEALRWLTQAATHGNTQAQFNLAIMYAKGEGTAKNPALSQRWMEKAALDGSADAQFALGIMYANKSDYNKAAFYYEKAAAQGHQRAQLNLGELFKQGVGVPQDGLQAFAWINLALTSKKLSESERRRAEGLWLELKMGFDEEKFAKARSLAVSYLQKYKDKTSLKA